MDLKLCRSASTADDPRRKVVKRDRLEIIKRQRLKEGLFGRPNGLSGEFVISPRNTVSPSCLTLPSMWWRRP